ncbi:tRNA (guanine-N(7)-)-methyltransferase [Beijerinckiaceae bacterium RH AL1]|nr:tRNA (guanosine(46)-N7)-methyltransferase TrmB [Beijerinckiaceae bacterium]VVB47583.1 tRNA (guanine-N(7)-)-methyltransferase [Beijerinckiaceae bacterium RH CH11]VVB47664.1 tRNA (guanine-N(7)-)-methyltransferase [Beijerinckiaceae bacterium RH AL8]VVC55963.1 tRNA (guanine-N(7)-)-methyltransferase [Beijerinckiaceae bacterium RH AL1]
MNEVPDTAGSAFVSRKLYGRRSGKALAHYQRELVRTLLPRLSLDPTHAIDARGAFMRPVRDIWLEVGFGAGEHLLATAAANPDIGMIGCEPFLNGVARALADLAGADLENIRLHCGDAAEIIDRLPDASLGRVFVFYPDPWPKRRQRKRRFLSDEMLTKLARVMRPGAELRFATDIDDKCGWTLARLLRSPYFVWTAERAADWHFPWPGWVETRYEQKAKAEGRRPCYITAVRR